LDKFSGWSMDKLYYWAKENAQEKLGLMILDIFGSSVANLDKFMATLAL